MQVERVKFTEVFHLDNGIHEQGEVSFPKEWLQKALIHEFPKDGVFLIIFEKGEAREYPKGIWVKEDPRPFLEQKEQ